MRGQKQKKRNTSGLAQEIIARGNKQVSRVDRVIEVKIVEDLKIRGWGERVGQSSVSSRKE